MSSEQPTKEEMEMAKAVIQQQMDALLGAMHQIEAAVNTNLEQLEERLSHLSAHVDTLKGAMPEKKEP